jgi:hypothetical protein
VARDDVADVAVAILLDDGCSYDVIGPEASTLHVAEELSPRRPFLSVVRRIEATHCLALGAGILLMSHSSLTASLFAVMVKAARL